MLLADALSRLSPKEKNPTYSQSTRMQEFEVLIQSEINVR